MLNADPSKVSMRAKKRGLPQVQYAFLFYVYALYIIISRFSWVH